MGQTGQAMVEYTVILLSLTAALLAPSLWLSSNGEEEGVVGLDQAERGSLLRAIANKHRGYGYALSLAEIPETDGTDEHLRELAEYYDSLGKYPGMSEQLKKGASRLSAWNSQLDSINQLLSRYVPPDPSDVCEAAGGSLGTVAGQELSLPGC